MEAGVGHYTDVGILAFIQAFNAGLAFHEGSKAADAVAALKSSLQPRATVKRGGVWATLDAAALVPGDRVKLGAGSAIPADVAVTGGEVAVDASALTGESLPVSTRRGDPARMGSTIVRGEAEAVVTATGGLTFFGRTAALLNRGVAGPDNITRVINRITLALSIVALALCTAVLAYLLARGGDVRSVLGFVVVLLVASIPIAIQIVATTTLAMGSRELAAHGAIVTRLAAVEELSGLNVLCSDKTGTLTLNKMVIQDDCPAYDGEVTGGFGCSGGGGGGTPPSPSSRADTLRLAALASKWREPPSDALDTMVLGAVDTAALDADGWEQVEYAPFDAAVKRTSAVVRAPPVGGGGGGHFFGVAKGAAAAISALLPDKGKNPAVAAAVARMNADVDALAARGVRCMAVARTADAQAQADVAASPWHLVGLLTFLDPPRPDTKQTLDAAMAAGVDVKMVTGDSAVIARETARVLGLGDSILAADDVTWPELKEGEAIPKDVGDRLVGTILGADGFAHVFPEHKFLIVEALRQSGFAVGMTGDGVNDAPALKRAHVGIAVAGATDAARAAADIVLTEPGLGTVIVALTTARCIFKRLVNFCVYRVAATIFLIAFFFIAAFALPPSKFQLHGGSPLTAAPGYDWPPYFQLPVIQLMLLVLLNDLVFTLIGRDNVRRSPRPDKWNLRAVFAVAAVLAAVPTAACLVALWAALDSHAPGSLFARLGLPGMPYEKVQILLYLLISVMSFLTLFAARERGPFWSSAPHPLLAGASTASLCVTILLACFWPPSVLTGIPLLGLARADSVSGYRLWPVWGLLWCGATFLVQDALKVAAWSAITRLDLFAYRTGGLVGVRDARTFDASPAAAAATGGVEGRLLEYRAKGAGRSLERASLASRRAAGGDGGGDDDVVAATLAAAVVDMDTASKAIAASRKARLVAGPGPAPLPADVEAGGGDGSRAAWERAAAKLGRAGPALRADVREELVTEVASVRSADQMLGGVLEARDEQQARRKGMRRQWSK